MSYPLLNTYLPDFEQVLMEEINQSNWKSAKTAQNPKKARGRFVRKLKTAAKTRDILGLIKEIKEFYDNKGIKGKASGLDAQVNERFRPLIRGMTHIFYNGQKIQLEDLTDEDFEERDVTISQKKTKRGSFAVTSDDINEYEKKFDRLLTKGAGVLATENVVGGQKYLKKNMERLFKRLKEQVQLTKRGKIKGKLAVIGDIDFEISSVFNAKSMKNYENRNNAYNYWKSVSKKFDKLRTEFNKFKKSMADSKDKRKETADLLAFDIDSINYIVEYDRKSISVKQLDVAAHDAFSAFLNLLGGIMEVNDIDNVRQITEEIFLDEGQQTRQVDISEDTATDTLPTEIVDARKLINEELPLDPLGIIYFRKELNEIGLVNTNLVGLTEQLRKYYEDLTEENEYPNLDVEDANALFDNFLDKLDNVRDTGDELFLPIFMANDEALTVEYRELRNKAAEIESNIKKFMDLFLNFLQRDRAILTNQINLDMLGLGSGKGGEGTFPRSGGRTFPWFNYKNFVAGSRGTQRYNMKEAKNLNEDITTQVNNICKIIADCFLGPQFSKYRAGIKLPFEGDFTLRLIAATRPIGEKYRAVSIVNERLLSRDTAFMTEDDFDDLIAYLKELAGADNIREYKKLYEVSKKFADALDNIFDDEQVENSINDDVASILGSIYRLLNDEEKAQAIDDGEHKFPKDSNKTVLDIYNERDTDEPQDIYAVQALVEAIRSRGTNLTYRTSGGESGDNFKDDKIQQLLQLLDRVAKSVVQRKLLEAHDTLRILKSQPVYHSMKNENNFEDMDSIISKMENEYNIDMNANEIVSIVKAVDSFEGIAREYGIDAEHVYILKANFR
jgi:hypothetical protein